MENEYFVGHTFDYPFEFVQDDVDNFAKASGDFNPIHLDKEFAKTTKFGKRILHGFLGGSVFSKVFGTIYPGFGTLYLSQNMTFYKPMYCEVKYNARFTILEINSEKHRALVKTDILDQEETLIISGNALIQHNDIL